MRKALIVGLNNYPNAELEGCINDAICIGNILEKNGDGSPNFSVRYVTDEKKVVSKAELKGDIYSLFQGPNEIALFYFSGHGTITSAGGYIVTPDFKKYDEGISMDEILNYANSSKARNKIIILDCCHAGACGNPSISGGSNAFLSEGLTVLTASRDLENAIESGGKGLFTSLLIDALQGGAADLRGNITLGGLYSYVDEVLGPWEQRPIFKTHVSKFTPIRTITPKIPLETLRKIKKYFSSPEEEYILDPTYEDTSRNSIEEHVTILKDLQKFESAGLVAPVGEEHMYYAAMNSKSCRLTALGYQYWRLANENKL
ncbi:MAG: caspase family protein [Candidatus Methanofastidiosa archaeon]|nr:caspase family protein [Candidatus Methanofastidiosa archaeon]